MVLPWVFWMGCTTTASECPATSELRLELVNITVDGDTSEDLPEEDWLQEGTLLPRDNGNLWITGHAGGRITTKGGAVPGEVEDTDLSGCPVDPVLEIGVWKVLRAPDSRLLGTAAVVDGNKVVLTYMHVDVWDALVQYEIGEPTTSE